MRQSYEIVQHVHFTCDNYIIQHPVVTVFVIQNDKTLKARTILNAKQILVQMFCYITLQIAPLKQQQEHLTAVAEASMSRGSYHQAPCCPQGAPGWPLKERAL